MRQRPIYGRSRGFEALDFARPTCLTSETIGALRDARGGEDKPDRSPAYLWATPAGNFSGLRHAVNLRVRRLRRGGAVEISAFAAAAAGEEAAAAGAEAGAVASAAGPEAAAAAGASLEATLALAAAPDEAGAADSSLRLLHPAKTVAASRNAMRSDFFTIASFRG